MSSERITDSELQAFVDNALDPAGKVEVIDQALADRETCERLLLDLRGRELGRILGSEQTAPSPRLAEAAARLTAAMSVSVSVRPRWYHRTGRLTGAVLGGAAALSSALILTFSMPVSRSAATPAYLEEAVASQRAATIRREMVSQEETPHFDPADVRGATRISIPALPDGWRIVDAQIFPSDFGPSLQLSIVAESGMQISLFAAHGATGAPQIPEMTQANGEALVAWARGGNTYVLGGTAPDGRLLSIAQDLFDNRPA